MKDLDIKLFYLSCHNLLKNKFGINHSIPRKVVYGELGRHFLIPKKLRIVALKELEEMQLIQIIDRDNVIILNCKLDMEKDASKFFKKVNLF